MKVALRSPAGVRTFWLRHDLQTFQHRLKAMHSWILRKYFGSVWFLESGSYAGSVYNATSTHKTFAAFTIDDLTNLMAKCPEYGRASAAWYCSAGFRDGVILRLVAAAGGNSVQTLREGVGSTFLGPYPIRVS